MQNENMRGKIYLGYAFISLSNDSINIRKKWQKTKNYNLKVKE